MKKQTKSGNEEVLCRELSTKLTKALSDYYKINEQYIDLQLENNRLERDKGWYEAKIKELELKCGNINLVTFFLSTAIGFGLGIIICHILQ